MFFLFDHMESVTLVSLELVTRNLFLFQLMLNGTILGALLEFVIYLEVIVYVDEISVHDLVKCQVTAD